MAATAVRCSLNRLLSLHGGSVFDNVVMRLRHNAWHHLQRSKFTQSSRSKGLLGRLTGLGTGLSLCAKPVIVPVDEKSKLLDIDPSTLTHSNLIRNAATVAVDAASALVSQSVIAAIELNQLYVKQQGISGVTYNTIILWGTTDGLNKRVKPNVLVLGSEPRSLAWEPQSMTSTRYVNELIFLYESHIINMGIPAEEYIWQEMIEMRVKADDTKRAAEEVECVLETALRALEYVGESAYQAGSEIAFITAGQRITLAQSQLEVARTISQNAMQELTRIQELSIVESTKRAEEDSKLAEQESQEAQQQPSVMAAA